MTRPEDEYPYARNERAVIMRTGTVTAVHASTLDVLLPGGPMPGVPLGGFTAIVGENVTVLLDRDSALAIGMVGNAGAGTGPPGPEGLAWRGPWSAATAYAIDDAVSDGGSSYIAIAAGTNHQPAASPTYWNILAAQGSAGPPGADSTVPGPPGAEGLIWRGAWSSATSYAVDDAVSVGGSSYIAILAGANHPPATSPTYWSVLAAQGSQGIQGIQGIQGVKGDQGIQGIQGVPGPPGPSVPFAMAAGKAAIADRNPDTGGSVVVTYPAGRFTQAPVITTGAATTNGYATSGSDGSTSLTSFVAKAYNPGATAATGLVVHWVATQMTSASGPGRAEPSTVDDNTPTHTVVCDTDGCGNSGIAIDVPVPSDALAVICGACDRVIIGFEK